MKAPSLRVTMAWIHGWLGLLGGWILFAMFLTGTVSFFRPEITRWMQPELRLPQVPERQAAETAVTYLQGFAPSDEQWTIYLPDERTTATRIFSRAQKNTDGTTPKRRPEVRIDPATGVPLEARATRGGEHFYRFHFQLQLPHPWGRWLAGLCAMFMLTAIISGVITHKRIFKDFFTLRWGRGQRSWLDAHNATAVLGLPFHAMITYTGLITLMAMYMPWSIAANYATPAGFSADAYGIEAAQPPSGQAAPLLSIGPLVDAATAEWQGRAGRVVIGNPNDASAMVTIVRHGGDTVNARGQNITFSGVTGERLSASPDAGPGVQTAGVMLGLHMGWFASPVVRWTYFLLSLAGTAMVGTGLVLWTAKRATAVFNAPRGVRLVAHLNVVAIACLPVGMAAFLLANRLISPTLAGRDAMEVSAMFWVWFGLGAVSFLWSVRNAWIGTLALGSLAFAALPIVNALTTDSGLFHPSTDHNTLFVAFDLAFLTTAAMLGFGAWRIARRAQITSAPELNAVSQAIPRAADAA